MSDDRKAVFISYASQDRDAALRTCEALRAEGVEVWFDQSELVGGDAWDAKIRRQISECALFVPVISANTQTREEGYFRREWNLAVNRTLDMVHDKTFLLPVVIDATTDATARVPDKFREVQWTRLAGGEASHAFCERVKRLLGLEAAPISNRRSEPEGRFDPGRPPSPELRAGQGRLTTGDRGQVTEDRRRPIAGWPKWLIPGAVVAVIAIMYFAFRPAPRVPATPASAAPTHAAQPPPDFAPAKSVAVLAFANFGGAQENEYFSDGITEELLNVLAKIPGLRVAARTSSFYFKDKNVPVPEIAAKLNVAYVVEGSVQQSGTRVKITAQLINAANGFHMWSDTFTRELKDVFAMQDEIAGLIAKNLQLSLGDAPRVPKTVDPEAHRLLLEGRYFWNQRNEAGFTQAEASLTKALHIDPQYAEAHSTLGGVYFIRELYRQNDGRNTNPTDVDRARTEAQRAIELDPALAEPHGVLGYSLMSQGRLRESEAEFQRALALSPNDAVVHSWHGLTLSTSGRLDAGLREFEQASQLDPLYFIGLQVYCTELAFARQFDQALRIVARAAALRTDIFIPNRAVEVRALLALRRNSEAVEKARLIRQNKDLYPRWYADSAAIHVLHETGFAQEAADFAGEVFKRLSPDSYLRGFVLAALRRFDEALPFLEKTPTAMTRNLFYDTMWDPWRDDPRFQQLMMKLGCVEEYMNARATLERMLREAKK